MGADDDGIYVRFSEELGLYIEMVIKGGEVEAVSLTVEAPSEPYRTDHPFLERVIGHIATGRDDLRDIPVHLVTSSFDHQVLEALREIPSGQVMSYGEVARKLGRPRAARAVGNACARNPVPIIIPCHRVVPASGRLGNYSGGGGPRTKEAILEREGALGGPKEKKL
ncbi:MAG: MGMT family protein [Methanomassiliicoccus sp.]|nr:MGMT family protein [Methanomassiliicoccus sp.]